MEFIRGDTIGISFSLKYKDDNVVSKEEIDSLFITIKKSIYTEEIIFQKTLENVEIDENGIVHLVFEPEDTECLEYGKYVFDIEVTLKSGYRKTKLSEFNITGETTFHGGDVDEN